MTVPDLENPSHFIVRVHEWAALVFYPKHAACFADFQLDLLGIHTEEQASVGLYCAWLVSQADSFPSVLGEEAGVSRGPVVGRFS